MSPEEIKIVVENLRAETGLGLMTCKSVLHLFNYDIEKAKSHLNNGFFKNKLVNIK